jgi:hypothetical protein
MNPVQWDKKLNYGKEQNRRTDAKTRKERRSKKCIKRIRMYRQIKRRECMNVKQRSRRKDNTKINSACINNEIIGRSLKKNNKGLHR